MAALRVGDDADAGGTGRLEHTRLRAAAKRRPAGWQQLRIQLGQDQSRHSDDSRRRNDVILRWDRALSIDARRRTFQTPAARWPLSLLALLVGLAMFTAGWPKAASGWLDPALLCAKGQLVSNYYAAERPTVVGHFMLTHGSAWFWKMMDWSTVAIELSFLPSAFSLRAFRTVATLAVFFHAGIHFSMDIFFYQNLLAYAMFVDWERQVDSGWLKQGQAAFDRLLQRVRPWMLPVGGLLRRRGVLNLWKSSGEAARPVRRRTLAARLDCRHPGRVVPLKCIVGFAGPRWRSLRRSSAPSRAGETAPEPPLVLFDGVCGLCNGFVDFVQARSPRRVSLRAAAVRVGPLRTRQGYGQGRGTGVDRVDRRRPTVQAFCRRVADPRKARTALVARLWTVLAPPPVRDFVLQVVARHRYRWFGRKSVCRVPTVAERTAFWPDCPSL